MFASPRLIAPLGRFALAAVVAGCVLLTLAARAGADPDAATVLADRYSPVIALQPQHTPFGPGEAYRQTSVDILLGNPQVVLRGAGGQVVRRGPTAQDLSAAPAGDYIELWLWRRRQP